MDEMQEKKLKEECLERMIRSIQAAPDAFYKLKNTADGHSTFAEEVVKGAEIFKKYLSG
jgi:hypothetical protein